MNDISISIEKGDILALVGANGAGKSTLTKALSGVISCDEGELFLTEIRWIYLRTVRQWPEGLASV